MCVLLMVMLWNNKVGVLLLVKVNLLMCNNVKDVKWKVVENIIVLYKFVYIVGSIEINLLR